MTPRKRSNDVESACNTTFFVMYNSQPRHDIAAMIGDSWEATLA
ncbi:hypothetical protein [Rhodopirellula baltica]|nr:hypothetical protein [Rhodopirellula baltica]